jgi:hypothetical protein
LGISLPDGYGMNRLDGTRPLNEDTGMHQFCTIFQAHKVWIQSIPFADILAFRNGDILIAPW